MAKSEARERVGRGSAPPWREIEAIFAIAGACYLALSFLSYGPGRAAANAGGPVGHVLSDLFVQGFGLAAFLIPAFIVVVAISILRGGSIALSAGRAAALAAQLFLIAATLALLRHTRNVSSAGGWIGGFVAYELQRLFSIAGATMIVATGLLLTAMIVTGGSVVGGITVAARRGRAAGQSLRGAASRLRARLRPAADPDDGDAPERAPSTLRERERERRDAAKKSSKTSAPPPILLNEPPEPRPVEKTPAKKGGKPEQLKQEEFHFAPGANFELPPLGFLDAPVESGVRLDEEALIASSRILQSKLADFGVDGKVVAVRPGPVITTFEFEPAPGVKVNRIVTLADDLSMALRAISVRILAPIPGKPVVGIEVSNPRREKVYLREIISSDLFQNAESKLALALGKDTTGNTHVTDLAKMPHLLMAGATGTGKSVSLNAMIMSILYKASPADVRFIMIDPKMLELSVYDHIPHLLVPVVTDPKKSANALANVMQQMDMRYRAMREKGVRSIDAYNRMLAREESEKRAGVIELTTPEDGDEHVAPGPPVERVGPDAPLVHEHLPRIGIIVDELADLMMTVGRDVEESITRLAQKARAAGIHLILATQRPSVDVITGLIKANFPARISFQVTSRIDSRTILDAIGSERLLGEGDCLFLPPGTARVTRIHGAYVSEAEINKVVQFWKGQGGPQYKMELLEGGDEEGGEEDGEDLHDEMYDQAVRVVTESRQASISWLQRRLRVGYNRAARMIERMEREGVVSTAEGARPREVLARRIDE